jgi:hypothetical protein
VKNTLGIDLGTSSVKLLLRHAEYCERLAEALIAKAQGFEDEAVDLWKTFCCDFGAYELELERYFDHAQTFRILKRILDKNTKSLVMGA